MQSIWSKVIFVCLLILNQQNSVFVVVRMCTVQAVNFRVNDEV